MIRFAKKSNYTNTNHNNNNVPSSMKTEIDTRKSRKIPASDMSNHEFNDVNWVPMSRNQKTRKPINPTSQKMTRKSSRIQDWVNFNIKSLGDSTAGSHDSDSGFEQSTKSNDFHSLYVEPWTNCHDEQTIKNRQQKLALPDHQQPPLMSLQNNHTTRSRHAQSHQHNTQQQHHDGDKVRIFVAGPSPRMEKKSVRKITNSAAAFYKSAGPNDERFYVSDKPTNVRHTQLREQQYSRKKKKIAPQPPSLVSSVTVPGIERPTNQKQQPRIRSIGNQTDNHHEIYSSLSPSTTTTTTPHVMNHQRIANKKTYLFATSSNEMAFPNKSMPPTDINRRNEALSNDDTRNPAIPEPDYSPIIIRKSTKKNSSNGDRRSTNIDRRGNLIIWGNAARYRGSLEELDQEEISPDESQGSSTVKVRDMAEKLKSQADRDRTRQNQRQAGRGDYQSLRPSIKKHSQDESPRNSSRRSVSEDREDSVLSDSFSMLSMSNSNIPHHLTNRMSQYSPHSWNMSSSRSNSSLPTIQQDDSPVSMMPCTHEQRMLNDVKGKQSHFFNSLFPSKANRFGFPVYPEKTFGIPSQMNAPVSFAGFSPEPSGSAQRQKFYNEEESSSSILSELPKFLLGRKKKYNVKKSRSGLFGLF